MKSALRQFVLNPYTLLLGRYLKSQRLRVIALAIALLVSIVLQLINPQILRYFIDTALNQGTGARLLQAALLFIGIALVTQGLTLANTYLGETIAWQATNALRADLTAHCLHLDLSFHQSRTPGELVERVDGDVTTLARFFSQFALYILGNSLLLLGILTVLWFEDWRAGLSLTLFVLVAFGFLTRLIRLALPAWVAYRQLSARFFGFLGEYLTGREDLQANGSISYVKHRFHGMLQQWLPIFHRARLAQTLLWGSSVALLTTGNVIALSVGAYLWSQNVITLGTVYLIFYYANQLRQPMASILGELTDFQQAQASILRVQELLTTPSRLPPAGEQTLPAGALTVAFDQVWFSYDADSPHDWALQDVSWCLPAGQVVGVVGRTGSGKTTLTRLLLRFYASQTGTIRLGRVPLETIATACLRQRVGIVTQEVQLFQATIRDNLRLFDPAIEDDQIQHALGELGLLDWLRSHPQGLDTLLAADSGGLSAGEAQLLAFARIWLRDPSLVILDEASSRLDPLTERRIEQATKQLMQGRTGIIIAHRLSTLQHVDYILVLDQGKVVEYGRRQDLANQPTSRFAHLLQMNRTHTSLS
ncbi:MAG: ABC transporter ATP-binding protein [Leptolyngbya sp. SIO1E4]|nr:ABC transporter ATP-binding protein [Leptolyngbya sp. SIO1E4]